MVRGPRQAPGVDLIVMSARGGAEVIASNFEPTFAAAASL